MSPRLPQNAAAHARRAPEQVPRSAGVWTIRQSRQNDIASRLPRESRPLTKSAPIRFTCSRTGPKILAMDREMDLDHATDDRTDVLIGGAGVAGLALAVALRQGLGAGF